MWMEFRRVLFRSGVYMVGDNQSVIEGPLQRKQIKGVLVEFIRNGKNIKVTNSFYYCVSHIWLIILPFREIIKKIVKNIYSIRKK